MKPPAIILIDPQLGENIGTTARAMLNCGLKDLRLVRPRDGWPNPKAAGAAAGADEVLEKARVYATTAEAIIDLVHVYATTNRMRGMVKTISTPRQAVIEMQEAIVQGKPCGVLFGPERTGLVNEDMTLADRVITVPLNPDFCSLNLAQAVLLVGYEWFQIHDQTPGKILHSGASPTATKEQIMNFFIRFESELDACGFFSTPDKRPGMIRNIRNAFQRMDMTEQEVRTFQGIVTCLAGRRESSKS